MREPPDVMTDHDETVDEYGRCVLTARRRDLVRLGGAAPPVQLGDIPAKAIWTVIGRMDSRTPPVEGQVRR
jgi:hypothetical protein